jgi:periplasmic divalent cation tolerance protein
MKRADEGVIILSTFSDERSLRALAKLALEAKLCACVNFTKVRSLYSWKGKQEDQDEILALFKTTRRSAAKLKKTISSNHPYEVPEIVEIKMSDVSPGYFSWLVAETLPDRVPQNRHDASK